MSYLTGPTPLTSPNAFCVQLPRAHIDNAVPTSLFAVLQTRPWEVHASQGLKVGLYIPTILGGNSYLSLFYDRGAIKDPAHTGTSKGLSQAIKRGPIRKFLPNYTNVYVTIQSHGLSAGVRTHYVTVNGVRNGLSSRPTEILIGPAILAAILACHKPANCDTGTLPCILSIPAMVSDCLCSPFFPLLKSTSDVFRCS